MANGTSISWCDSTFNPWIGCTKVGPGCDHCYAERDFDLRKGRVKWGLGNPRSRTSVENWNKPRLWERQHAEFFAEHGRRRRVFCASLADVFDNEVDPSWRVDLLGLIRICGNLDFLILTKRVSNVLPLLREAASIIRGEYACERVASKGHRREVRNEAVRGIGCHSDLLNWIDAWLNGKPPENVWLGATMVTRKEFLRDIDRLRQVPAAIRFVSAEPLLDDVGDVDLSGIDWLIVGGESGPHARPMEADWVRNLRNICARDRVSFHFKQWGGKRPKDGGCLLDGMEAKAWPCAA